MILNTNQITVDIKVTDRYRKILSQLSNKSIELKCIMLGDSDIDYELSQDINNARILNAPYNPEAIKFPLIYNGLGNGIKGVVTSFIRYVDENGNVLSYYDYPLNDNLTIGIVPPTLRNGIDKDLINFTNNRMGAIIFLQTLMDYYRTDDGVQERLKETYDIEITFNGSQNIPLGWQITSDFNNGSLLIAKDSIPLTDSPSVFNGLITVKGNISNVQKNILFNI